MLFFYDYVLFQLYRNQLQMLFQKLTHLLIVLTPMIVVFDSVLNQTNNTHLLLFLQFFVVLIFYIQFSVIIFYLVLYFEYYIFYEHLIYDWIVYLYMMKVFSVYNIYFFDIVFLIF